MKEKGLSFAVGILVGVILCTGYYYLLGHKGASNGNHKRGNGSFSRYKDGTGSGSSNTFSGNYQRENLKNNQ